MNAEFQSEMCSKTVTKIMLYSEIRDWGTLRPEFVSRFIYHPNGRCTAEFEFEKVSTFLEMYGYGHGPPALWTKEESYS